MELLQFLHCEFTHSVFTKETNYSSPVTRDKLIKKLGIKENVDPKKPLLLHILLKGGGLGGGGGGLGGGFGGGLGGGLSGGLIGGLGGGEEGRGGGIKRGGVPGGGGLGEENGGRKGQEKVSFKDDKQEKNMKPGQQESQKSTSLNIFLNFLSFLVKLVLNAKLPSAFAKKSEVGKKNPYDFELPGEDEIFGKKKPDVPNKFGGVFENNENLEEQIEEEVVVEEDDEPIKKVKKKKGNYTKN